MNTSNLLEVRNATKVYQKFTLDHFSFSVKKGRIVGFIGRNGAGKTTTLKGIMNLLHFDEGEVFFLNKNMKEFEKEAKEEIGFTLSELNYYPNKKVQQLADVIKRFYPTFSEDRFKHLSELFNLDVNKKLQELSSGMKVKYSLALALSHDAKLLILDEPTSGLDPISRDEILDIFRSIVKSGERSIIFSTHITSDLDKCADDVLYIQKGKKVYEGTKEDFVNSYLLVSGSQKDFKGKIEEIALAHKENGDKFEALIKKEDEEALLSSFVTKKPDLEEIMIYLERGKEHEEFVL